MNRWLLKMFYLVTLATPLSTHCYVVIDKLKRTEPENWLYLIFTEAHDCYTYQVPPEEWTSDGWFQTCCFWRHVHRLIRRSRHRLKTTMYKLCDQFCPFFDPLWPMQNKELCKAQRPALYKALTVMSTKITELEIFLIFHHNNIKYFSDFTYFSFFFPRKRVPILSQIIIYYKHNTMVSVNP